MSVSVLWFLPRVVVVLCAFAALIAPAQATTLNDAERRMASRVAASTPWDATASQTHAQASLRLTPSVSSTLGIQELAVDAHTHKSGPAQRLVHVWQFHHGAQLSRRLLIDLDDARVLEQRTIGSPHLPLNELEEAWVNAMIATDTHVLAGVNKERERLGQVPLASLDTLDAKIIIFEPSDNTARCATRRCAAVSLFDDRQRAYTTEAVVEFASGVVTLGFSR